MNAPAVDPFPIDLPGDIRIRRIQLVDAGAIFAAINEHRSILREHDPFDFDDPAVADLAGVTAGITAAIDEAHKGGNLNCGAWHNDRFIGRFFARFRPTPDGYKLGHHLMIGYWIIPPYWGKGIAPLVVRELCRLAFDQYGTKVAYCGIDPDNRASIRAAEKAGFIRAAQPPDVFTNPSVVDPSLQIFLLQAP